jgi:mannosyl-oligosaccharide alpha-1,2-mannosidase
LSDYRILGGLAAAHDLSGDPLLGDKAKDLADRLLPAFDAAPTGLITNTAHLPRVQPDGGYGSIILAEMGSNVLEFASVSRITGVAKYREMAEKGLRAVHAANKNVRALCVCGCMGPMDGSIYLPACMPACLTPGRKCVGLLLVLTQRHAAPPVPCLQALLFESVDRQTAKEQGWSRGVGAGTDSYYEYLIKYWVLGGSQDEHFRARWEQATDEALATLMVYPHGWPFSYLGDLRAEQVDTILEHLRCFYPGADGLYVWYGAVCIREVKMPLVAAAPFGPTVTLGNTKGSTVCQMQQGWRLPLRRHPVQH